MVNVDMEARGLADDFGSKGLEAALHGGIKYLCARVREDTLEQAAKLAETGYSWSGERIAAEIRNFTAGETKYLDERIAWVSGRLILAIGKGEFTQELGLMVQVLETNAVARFKENGEPKNG